MARKAKKSEPRKPRRSTDNQIYIRTTSEVVRAAQSYADQEDRSLSKAAERLLIDALQARGLLERTSPGAPAQAYDDDRVDRVRGGAEVVP